MQKRYKILGIGNAIVDIIAFRDSAFLKAQGIEKGVMSLIDTARAKALLDVIGHENAVSGGSAANTITALSALDIKTAYIGKVKDDALGALFMRDMRQSGTEYASTPNKNATDAQTGYSIIIVSEDGERSMSTYLGATETLTQEDIDPALVASAEWIYLEGYRFDGAASHAAFAKAINACKAGGGKVALTLSDPFCVERHRAAFMNLIKSDVDLLFGNRAEIISLAQIDDFAQARGAVAAHVPLLACTDSENGAYIHSDGQILHIPAEPCEILDANGAGDAFAAGFLYGYLNGQPLALAATMGCALASDIITQVGARAKGSLQDSLKRRGLFVQN